MGGLHSRSMDLSGAVKNDPDKMTAGIRVGDLLREKAGCIGGQWIRRSLQTQQGWKHEQHRGNERGNRISGNAEQKLFPEATIEKWFAGFHRYPPELDGPAQSDKSRSHKVVFSHRNTTGRYNEVGG